jgi:hypothetical protein
MFGVTLANAAMGAGLLALALPVLIHLLTRRTPVFVVFPTIRFLERAKAAQSNLFQVRHWLMMLLRTMALAAILAAFLRPEYRASAVMDQASKSGESAVVLVLDASMSMGYTGGGVSPFSKAKAAAAAILEGLQPSDVANIIVAGTRPRAFYEEPIPNHSLLKRDLEAERVTLARADMDGALAAALEQFQSLPSHRKEIHLISDFQRTNWAAVDFAGIPEHVGVVLVPVSPESPMNAAIIEADPEPAVAVEGEAVELVCRIANYSPATVELPVEVTFGGTRQTRRVIVEPFISATARFPLAVSGEGIFEGSVSIAGDNLPGDDQRVFTVDVKERLAALILTDAPHAEPRAGHRFLRTALDPNNGRGTIFVPELGRPDDFDRFQAARYKFILLSEVGLLSESTALTLLQYLKDGGALAYFLSMPTDRENVEHLARLAADLKLPFVPIRLVDSQMDPDANFAVLHQANYEHPMLMKFRESDALADLQFFRYFETDRQAAQGQVLLGFDNSHVALALQSYGLGSLLLANFGARLDTSNLPKHPIFVPLVHEMVKALRPRAGSTRTFAVGAPCSTTVVLNDPDVRFRFTTPSGEEIGAGLDIRAGEGAVIFDETVETGFYRVFAGGHLVGSVPVNTDPRESNLEALTEQQVRELARDAAKRMRIAAGTDIAGLRYLHEGRPIWQYFLLAAAGFLMAEQLAALVWKR